MIDYELIKTNVKKQLAQQFPNDKATDKLLNIIADIATNVSLAVLKEYDKQKSIED